MNTHSAVALVVEQRPDGSLIEFSVEGLSQDTLFEFRVRYKNSAGFSPYSLPSHRYVSIDAADS